MDAGNDKRGPGVVFVRTLELRPTPEAPSAARRWLDEIPRLRVLGQVAFDVRLLVTELVANSVRHAGLGVGDLITITLELGDGRLRVEVRDPGAGFDFPLRPQKLERQGGRGLQIVAAIAHRWGVERAEPVVVWFEIGLEESIAAAASARLPRASVRALVP